MAQRILVVAEDAIEEARQRQDVRRRAFVAELVSAHERLQVRLARTLVHVGPPPVRRGHPQRLREYAPVVRRSLQGEGGFERVPCSLAPEQRLGQEFGPRRLRG